MRTALRTTEQRGSCAGRLVTQFLLKIRGKTFLPTVFVNFRQTGMSAAILPEGGVG